GEGGWGGGGGGGGKEGKRQRGGDEPQKSRRVDGGKMGKVYRGLTAFPRHQNHPPPHRDAQPVRSQRFLAELFGNDRADPVNEIGQEIAEVELSGVFH